MSPDQRFALLVRTAIGLFCVLFIYFLVADIWMPMTPEARVMRPVVRVAPQVSGPVSDVQVENNQQVQRGDLLFRIDDDPFVLARDKSRLALEQARQDNASLAASLAAARAQKEAARAKAEEQHRERSRAERLIAQHSISRQQLDSLVASDQSAQAELQAAEAQVAQLEVELGEEGDANLRLRQARNALAQAELDLEHTSVRAEHTATVSNLQLENGDFISRGQAVLAMVVDSLDLVADFREKSLRQVAAGDSALVVFDGIPGQAFDAHVISRDAGVQDGQLIADGNLADIPSTDRWVRDAQRIRIHLSLDESLPRDLPSGARATVQLLPGDNLLAHAMGALQVRLMSWLHYVY
ncbi:HlyD family secretion protein [Halomonas huangheensis]|uniref:Uncharacterized protein n=1 Tax=Halomonas huangheensis TaxID=1178482 RepID=W1NCU1_9GAMM|nr:HlyD family secretion protein [Halomonas huangheensis]ALM52712.1 hemolysin D [Halomonas huangheensis]ERL52755.1 hypothetical protein BJB45_15865 [Halomonas huangheensis]